ncbi:SDR family oxidoreductase [Aminobacter sp. MSH1]|uniref:SDR family NAD(P)-dependent oxidoreductase n=1 Tax=Aminobacter sp. MSH1 TaxID=374606 RepID=UPI000D38D510|nr:SDR family oxidoreductase [Aminobacter sp. MSH1]
MSERLSGKTALIIGAGSIGPGWGNGKATACLFAREGARVFCVDINMAAAEETVEIIKSEGGSAVAWKADVTKPDDVSALAESCVNEFGRIDIMCNNVGIAEVGGVVDLPVETWDRVFDVNLKSCFLTMKYVIPHMVENGGGSIINVSSIASLRYTGVAYASYSASKAAVNHLTRTTAAEFASSGVRVNAVLPGLMKTPMVEHSTGLAKNYAQGNIDEMWRVRAAQCPMGFMGDAWDVANAALFLASPESKYVTGIELLVDGGITLKYA